MKPFDPQQVVSFALGGIPQAVGRWQPTRAGVVNSWAWSEETFHFANGWMALTGPNGSGKSLTASMWLTPLLDADVSAPALSVSGTASGTLGSRHTNRDPRSNRAGTWWLEYGFRTEPEAAGSVYAGAHDDAPDVQYVTTGLWLRNTGEDLRRAFFIAPVRVGTDLLLCDSARNAVNLEELAEQLQSLGGSLYTNNAAVRQQALRHLTAVGRETEYVDTVRRQLFTPLDEVQFAALASVLRSLRKVRTSEGVRPEEMHEVLTQAMPALEPDRLAPVAEAMERISDLEKRLASTKDEIEQLAGTEKAYQQYVSAVLAVEAAALTAAVTKHDEVTREERAAREKLAAAERLLAEAQASAAELQSRRAALEGRHEALIGALAEHGGADIPNAERLARQLRQVADQAARSAGDVRARADREVDAAATAGSVARRARAGVRDLAGSVRLDGQAAGAAAVMAGVESLAERLINARLDATPSTLSILDAQADPTSAADITDASDRASAAGAPSMVAADLPDELEIGRGFATPDTWIDARLQRITQIEEILGQHQTAIADEAAEAKTVRRLSQVEDEAAQAATHATRIREAAEHEFLVAVQEWSDTLRELNAPPTSLLDGSDGDAGEPSGSADGGADRRNPARFTTYLAEAVRRATDRIDLTNIEQVLAVSQGRLAEARRLLETARATVARRSSEADTSRAKAASVNAELVEERADDEAILAAADRDRQAQHADVERLRAAATTEFERAQGIVAEARGALHTALAEWAADLAELELPVDVRVVLSADGSDGSDAGARAGIGVPDLASARSAASAAHTTIRTRLADAAARESHLLEAAQTALTQIREDLAAARTAAPVPPAPPWRPTRARTALWELVDFAEHLQPEERDALEGALLVSGLLDAYVGDDGTLHAGDLTVHPALPGPPAGSGAATLADVLVPDPQAALPATTIEAVLLSVPLPTVREALAGKFGLGAATAVAPDGYRAAFIGRSARERSRLARVAELDLLDQQCAFELARHEQELADLQARTRRADDELESFPDGKVVLVAEEQARQRERQLDEAQRRAWAIERAADDAHAAVRQDVDARESARQLRSSHADQDLAHRKAEAEDAQAEQERREADVEHLDEQVADDLALAEEARAAQERMGAEAERFPPTASFAAANAAEDRAEDDNRRAQSDRIAAEGRRAALHDDVKTALAALNRAAHLPDGSMLPTTPKGLSAARNAAGAFRASLVAWRGAAVRVIDLVVQSRRETARAATTTREAQDAAKHAAACASDATRAEGAYQQLKSQFGANYTELEKQLNTVRNHLRDVKSDEGLAATAAANAGSDAAVASSKLEGIAPQREEATTHRDRRLGRINRLIGERLRSVPDDIPTDERGHLILTQAVTWARRVLSVRPVSGDRRQHYERLQTGRLSQLEHTVRDTSKALARFDRQVTLVTIEGTDWRRAEVAAPDSAAGLELSMEMTQLRDTSAQLEADLREDIKQTLKTSIFAQLRRDIVTRREAAQELVRRISETLAGVRTGVALVGVKVSWQPRQDDNARRMIDLVSAPPSDEGFEQMYQVLRSRMEETTGQRWEDRVEHAFDYRSWHEWIVDVTHASFSEGRDEEVFRRVVARNNPMASFSTGEQRLATMLPLLAAAWSMYSGPNYRGPRPLSIDEIDAAFDEPNLRQVLALLRGWGMDVVATAPAMSPLIKAETGEVVVHEVAKVSAGLRVATPWVWAGQGEPTPLHLQVGDFSMTARPRSRGATASGAANQAGQDHHGSSGGASGVEPGSVSNEGDELDLFSGQDL